MKKIYVVFIGLFLCVGSLAQNEIKDFVWTKEKAEKHLKNQSDPTKWDMTLFKQDLETVNMRVEKPSKNPITYGAFPVPKYKLIEGANFRGMGNFWFNGSNNRVKKIGDKSLIYNTFFTGRNSMNSKYIGNKNSEVFFQIILLTDYVNPLNKDGASSHVTSRNHPHYIGEGSFQTKNNKIDYTAFITADRNSYAIVNMRLFDLKLGKTILIAPQKDKSLRSFQIKMPNLSYSEIDSHTNKILKRKDVIDFFTKKGNI